QKIFRTCEGRAAGAGRRKTGAMRKAALSGELFDHREEMAVGARQVDRVLLALVGEEAAAAGADEIDRLGIVPAAVAGQRGVEMHALVERLAEPVEHRGALAVQRAVALLEGEVARRLQRG